MSKYLILFLSLSACGLKETANDMKASTEEIRDNSRNMPTMNDNTTHLAKRTDDLEYEGTLDRTTTVMEENMQKLWRENVPLAKGMTLPNGEAEQLLYGGVTIKSMWFQFWKGDYRESIANLDHRFDEGTQILFTRAMSYAPANGDVNGLFGYIPDFGWTGIAALGVSLDYVSDRYQESAIKAGLTSYTYYDVIMQALRIRNGSNEVTQFPRTVKRLRLYARPVEYMMQLRHNFLPVMVVCFLTDFKDQWLFMRALSSFVGQRPSLSSLDVSQLRDFTVWLKDAAKTRRDLRAAGIEPRYNWTLRKMLKNVDFGQAKLLAQPFESLNEIERARAEFAAAYVAVTMDDAPAPLEPVQPKTFALPTAAER